MHTELFSPAAFAPVPAFMAPAFVPNAYMSSAPDESRSADRSDVLPINLTRAEIRDLVREILG